MAKAKKETAPVSENTAQPSETERIAQAVAPDDVEHDAGPDDTVNRALGSVVAVADANPLRPPNEGEGEDSRRRNAMVRKALQRLGVPESEWDRAISVLGGVDLETLTGRVAVVKYVESLGIQIDADRVRDALTEG